MDDSFITAMCAFVPCVIGIGIYLLVDTVRNHHRRRLAAMKTPSVGQSPSVVGGIFQLDYRSTSRRKLPDVPRPSTRAVVRGLCILLVWSGVIWCIEYYEYRPRHIVLTFVDAVTGAPVAMQATYDVFNYAQTADYAHYQFQAQSLAPNVVRCDFNCATALSVNEPGYKAISVDLDQDQSPRVIELQPELAVAAPATVPVANSQRSSAGR